MTLSNEQIGKLKSGLDSNHIKTRKKTDKLMLSYVSGDDIMRRANEVFDFDWSYSVTELVVLDSRPYKKYDKDYWSVSYRCLVRIDAKGIIKEDVGVGHGHDKDLGQAHESASKEAVTDAIKRALRSFGESLGLALYDKSKKFVYDGNTVNQTRKNLARCDNLESLKTLFNDLSPREKRELVQDFTNKKAELVVAHNKGEAA